jgi:hypothetical protein
MWKNIIFSIERDLDNCDSDFRTGIIDVIENKVVVPLEYCSIKFDYLPREIDSEERLVFRCVGPQPRTGGYAPDAEWITLEGKKVSIKYE